MRTEILCARDYCPSGAAILSIGDNNFLKIKQLNRHTNKKKYRYDNHHLAGQ